MSNTPALVWHCPDFKACGDALTTLKVYPKVQPGKLLDCQFDEPAEIS